MRQIEYQNSSFLVRFEFPSNWDAETITGVNVKVTSTGGTELLAATAASLWTTDTIRLNGSVSAFGDTITLEEAGGGSVPDLTTGDRLRIQESPAGPWEEVEVVAWSPSTKVAQLERSLRFDHSDEAAVTALFCTYSIDLSDTDTFPLNKRAVFTWDPDNDALPIKEMAEVALFDNSQPVYEELFSALYPYEYKAATEPDHRLPTYIEQAERQVRLLFRLRHLDIARVVDSEVLVDLILTRTRYLILLNGDDRYDADEEREQALIAFNEQFELVAALPIWQDTDQDEIMDDDEVSSHQWTGFERGL